MVVVEERRELGRKLGAVGSLVKQTVFDSVQSGFYEGCGEVSRLTARQRARGLDESREIRFVHREIAREVWKTRVFRATRDAGEDARKVKQSKGWRLVVMIRENARRARGNTYER